MPKKRFNIWLDELLIEQIKAAAIAAGIDHVSSYCRVACLEKMRRDSNEPQDQNVPKMQRGNR